MHTYCLLTLFVAACLGSEPQSLSAESLLAPLTMRGLEQQARRYATHNEEQQIIQRADNLGEQEHEENSMDRLKREADAFLTQKQNTARSSVASLQKEALQMHAQRDSQNQALMQAVTQEKTKHAAEQKGLKDAAQLRTDNRASQKSDLGDSAGALQMTQAQEKAQKAEEARTARREFLRQAQKLSTAAVQAMGTSKEIAMAKSAEKSNLKALSATAAYEKAKQNTELESQEVARADNREAQLVMKELKIKISRGSSHAAELGQAVNKFDEKQNRVQAASIKRWSDVQHVKDDAIKVHGAWKAADVSTELGERSSSTVQSRAPCSAIQRLRGDALCEEELLALGAQKHSAPNDLVKARSFVAQAEEMLHPHLNKK